MACQCARGVVSCGKNSATPGNQNPPLSIALRPEPHHAPAPSRLKPPFPDSRGTRGIGVEFAHCRTSSRHHGFAAGVARRRRSGADASDSAGGAGAPSHRAAPYGRRASRPQPPGHGACERSVPSSDQRPEHGLAEPSAFSGDGRSSHASHPRGLGVSQTQSETWWRQDHIGRRASRHRRPAVGCGGARRCAAGAREDRCTPKSGHRAALLRRSHRGREGDRAQGGSGYCDARHAIGEGMVGARADWRDTT